MRSKASCRSTQASAFSHNNGRLRVEGFMSNVTGDVHEAAQIITQFDNTRFFTRPRLAGVRASYRFGDL